MSLRIWDRVSATARLGWAVTREAGASILTYELYPLGVIPKIVPVVPSHWITADEPHLPILFIHGVFQNPAAFAWLKNRLAWAGYRHFREIHLFPSIRPIPVNAERVARKVEQMRREYDVPAVNIVAHSMGGILARYFIQLMKGDRHVRYLITLGTPHQGTTLSRLAVSPYLKELSPQSETLRRLNASAPPVFSQGVAISGSLDLFVRPLERARWEGVRNIQLDGVGHAGLLFSRRVANIIISYLGGSYGLLQPRRNKLKAPPGF